LFYSYLFSFLKNDRAADKGINLPLKSPLLPMKRLSHYPPGCGIVYEINIP